MKHSLITERSHSISDPRLRFQQPKNDLTAVSAELVYAENMRLPGQLSGSPADES